MAWAGDTAPTAKTAPVAMASPVTALAATDMSELLRSRADRRSASRAVLSRTGADLSRVHDDPRKYVRYVTQRLHDRVGFALGMADLFGRDLAVRHPDRPHTRVLRTPDVVE